MKGRKDFFLSFFSGESLNEKQKSVMENLEDLKWKSFDEVGGENCFHNQCFVCWMTRICWKGFYVKIEYLWKKFLTIFAC